MAKMAQLHDGTMLEFPDETPDEVVDAAVQEHLASIVPEIDPLAVFTETVSAFRGALGVIQEKAAGEAEAIDNLAEVHAAAAQLKNGAVEALGERLEGGLQQISDTLSRMEQQNAILVDIIGAVDSLAEVVLHSAARVTEAMLAPIQVGRSPNNVITSLARQPKGAA